jgi:hypothetical protein
MLKTLQKKINDYPEKQENRTSVLSWLDAVQGRLSSTKILRSKHFSEILNDKNNNRIYL